MLKYNIIQMILYFAYNRLCFKFRPQITEDELKMVRMAIQYELEDAQMKPDQEPLLLEAIHAAAYNR